MGPEEENEEKKCSVFSFEKPLFCQLLSLDHL